MKAPFGLQIQNPLPGLRTISIQDGLFILLSLFYFVFAFHLYKSSEGLPGFTQSNVDELYFVYLPAVNYYHFGLLNSCFLPDYATGPEPSAHPYVYIHNIGFPNWIGYLFILLGFTKVEHFSFASIFFRRYVGPWAAITLFFLIISSYQEVLTHCMGFFRPFQWIFFFSVPYAFFHWVQRPESRVRVLLVLFSLLFAVAYEYTFALKMYILLVLLYFFDVYGCRRRVTLRTLLSLMLVGFLIPKTLQTLMVWGLFDLETALRDTVATLINRLVPVKNPSGLEAYYAEKGILFWVYGDKPGPLAGILSLLRDIMAVYGVVPVVGAAAIIGLHFFLKFFVSIPGRSSLILESGEKLEPDIVFETVKRLYVNNKTLIWVSFCVCLYSLTLLLAYNGYREASKGYDHVLSHFIGDYVVDAPELSKAVRHSIKVTLPWAILVFTVCYLLQVFSRDWQALRFSLKDYAIVVFYSACILNVLFIFRREALVVLNLSLMVFFVWQTALSCRFFSSFDTTQLRPGVIFEDAKRLYAENKGLIWRTALLVGLYSLALILAYNGYRETSKGYKHVLSHFIGDYVNTPRLPKAIAHSIRETFPWAILVFTACYLLQVFKGRRQADKSFLKDYTMAVLYSVCVLNVAFIFRTDALVVLNMSFMVFFVLVFVLQPMVETLACRVSFNLNLSQSGPPTLFEDLRRLCVDNKVLIWRTALNAGLYFLALMLAYNGYKEVFRGYDHMLSHFVGEYVKSAPELPRVIRRLVKGTFPWAILVFTACYLLQVFRCKRQALQFSIKDYAKVMLYSACVLNAAFIFRRDALIVLNWSFISFFILLFVPQALKALHSIFPISIAEQLDKIRLQPIVMQQEGLVPVDYVALVSCTVLSFLAYIGVFYTHAHMVNVGCHSPLIEMYTIMVTCLVVCLIYRFMVKVTNSVFLPVLFVCVVILVQVDQFIRYYRVNPPVPMSAYDVLPKYEGKTFVTSYHSVYPAIFTKQWVIPNWTRPITPENVTECQHIWMKDRNTPEGQKKYSSPEYLLYISRMLAPPIDMRMKNVFEIVEKGPHYEIYKLR